LEGIAGLEGEVFDEGDEEGEEDPTSTLLNQVGTLSRRYPTAFLANKNT